MMDNKINGRTPEEIKKVLECCYGNKERRLCEKCPNACKVEGYSELICTDFDSSGENALALIQQLERERDAAVELIKGDCKECKHVAEKWLPECRMNPFCLKCITNDYCNWQWRGVQEVE